LYNNLCKVLMTSPLFKGILEEELTSMLACLQPKKYSYKKNSYITLEGEKFHGLGILLTGEGAVIKENAAGNRNIMTILGVGDVFGEMIAFSENAYWPASVFAQTDCSAIFLPSDKIIGECSTICPGHTQLIKNFLLILSQKALLLNRKVQYLTLSTMRSKISTYLLEQHHRTRTTFFHLPLRRNDLADFLNVSRTGLSREMGRMRDEGLIEFYRASIKIKNLEGLIKLAGL